MNEADYQAKALEYVRRHHPELDAEKGDNFTLALKGPQTFFLDNAYKEMQHRGEEHLEDILEKYLNQTTLVEQFFNATWEEAQPHILPQLKMQDQIEHINREILKTDHGVVSGTFLPPLEITWVIDNPEGYSYVTQQKLNEFQQDAETLADLALEHLTNLPVTKEGPKLVNRDDGVKFLIWETRDGYDAVRILLPELYDLATKTFGADFIAVLPLRDLLVVGAHAQVHELQNMAADAYNRGDHPLCPYPIQAGEEGFRWWNEAQTPIAK